MHEALLYEKLEDQRVRCNLCAHRCIIGEGKFGVCKVRRNEGGKLITWVYGRAISQHVDPVEKKPLYHFYPDSTAFSVATPGCNFQCDWCQNADIAQMPRERGYILGDTVAPETVVANAKRSGSRSIAYTYTEPTIFYEYAYDCSRLAHKEDIANIYVTNGYMTPEMLEHYTPYLDAANVDLKAFRKQTYQHYIGATLQPVLDSLIKMKQLGIWVEVTTLVVPGVNDDPEELRDIAKFIMTELDSATPWHLSRFHPTYKMSENTPTSVPALRAAKEIGLEAGMKFVYLGNTAEDSSTYCPQCNELLIQRTGYYTTRRGMENGKCRACGTEIEGVWE
ncbi:MAG: AmmeMemoRadiSam system radical SAM enzyme [Anaerolineales bacterium]|nr:AmmeMemoRadiSam system radical SAM enzyme [Anaerolineales bacterium]